MGGPPVLSHYPNRSDTSEKTPIVTCLDRDSKTGFGFYLGFNGKYSFETYIGGWR